RIGELLSGRNRLSRNLSRRVYRILFLYGVYDLGDGNIKLGQPIRADPAAHGVLPCAEDCHPGDPFYPSQLVDNVNVGIIRKESLIMASFGRIECKEHERRGKRLLDRNPEVPYLGRELALCLGFSLLG